MARRLEGRVLAWWDEERGRVAFGDPLPPQAPLSPFLRLTRVNTGSASMASLCGLARSRMNLWLHKTVLAHIAANGGNVPADPLD